MTRTVTQSYVFPPARPTTVPSADQCTDDDLLDLAGDAMRREDQLYALLGSRQHVAAICHLLVERTEPALRQATESRDTLQHRVDDLAAELLAERLEVTRLRAQLIKRSAEHHAIGQLLIQVSFERATLTIAGCRYEDLMRQSPVTRPSRATDAYHSFDLSDVIDAEAV